MSNRILTCSFCGNPLHLIKVAVESTHALICNECIADAVAIVAKELRKRRDNSKPALKVQKG